jgi:sulfatase maturation enzyme AslB (radical SAM superfamily)
MKSLKKIVIEKKICPIPWVHAEISFNTKVKPCCKYTSQLNRNETKFSDVWFNYGYENLRYAFVNQLKDQNCSACDVNDNSFSYQKFKTLEYLYQGMLDDLDIDHIKLPKILHLSTNDNTCNLACRMCDPTNSSKLLDIAEKSDLKKFYNIDKSVNDIKIVDFIKDSLSDVEKINITGGEPMLDKNLISFVSLLSESKKLKTIGFSTNMTIINKKLLDLLSEMTEVKKVISISLDGPDYIHEYIRYPCKYSDIVENISYISNKYPKKFIFNINHTVSLYNVGYVKESLDSWKKLKEITGISISNIMTSPVIDPQYLNAGVVPNFVKTIYLEKIKSIDASSYNNLPKVKEIINTVISLLSEDNSYRYQTFLEFNEIFDNITKQSFFSTYPEFVKK